MKRNESFQFPVVAVPAASEDEVARYRQRAGECWEKAMNAAEPAETVYVLPTYTAMLAMRDILQRTGYVRGFWED